MQNNGILKMMMGFTRGIKRFVLLSIFAAAAAALMGFLTPLIVGFTVDFVIGGRPVATPAPVMWLYDNARGLGVFGSSLLVCAVLVTLTAVLAGVFNYISRVSMAKFAERMINNLRTKLFAHTQSLPFRWHTQNLTGDIIQRCTSDVETARRFVFQQLLEVLRTAIMIVMAIAIMF